MKKGESRDFSSIEEFEKSEGKICGNMPYKDGETLIFTIHGIYAVEQGWVKLKK